jgi:hypothetical protein
MLALIAEASSVPRPSVSASSFACSRRRNSWTSFVGMSTSFSRPIAEIADVLADDHPGHHGLGDRVAAQPIEAVHVPARGLARGEQALERRALARVVGPHPAHRVVLRRPHRDPLLRRIDAEEVVADLEDFAQVVP